MVLLGSDLGVVVTSLLLLVFCMFKVLAIAQEWRKNVREINLTVEIVGLG